MGYKVYGNDIQEINNVKTLLNHRVKQYDAIIKDINSATIALKTKCDGEYVTALIIKLDQIKTALKQQKENSLHLIKLSTKFVKIFHNDCHSLDLDEDLLLQNQSIISQRINALDTVKVSLLTDHALQLHRQYMRNVSSLKNNNNKKLKLLHNAVDSAGNIYVHIKRTRSVMSKVCKGISIYQYFQVAKSVDFSLANSIPHLRNLVGYGSVDEYLWEISKKNHGYCADQRFKFGRKKNLHCAKQRFKFSVKDQIKSDYTIKGFKDSWKNASKFGKFTKGLGAVGTVFTVFDNFQDNIGSKIWNGEKVNGSDVLEFGTDTAVDIGSGIGIAAIGAAVGGPVGVVAAVGLGWALNAKLPSGKSAIDYAKDSVSSVCNWVGSWF